MKPLCIVIYLLLLVCSSEAIVSGFSPDLNFSSSIFKIRSKSTPSSVCTGVLYAKDKILTAFHCVALTQTNDLYVGGDHCESRECSIVGVKNVLVPRKANLAYTQISNFRELRSNGSVALNLLNFLKKEDLAIVELKEKLQVETVSIIPAGLARELDFPLPYFYTSICGYGYYSPPKTMWSNALYGEKHCDYFEIDSFGENYYLIKPTVNSSIAQGDSGAGLIVDIHGKKFVYGILSGYGTQRGPIGNFVSSIMLLLETGYAVPVSDKILDVIEFERHDPKLFESKFDLEDPRQA